MLVPAEVVATAVVPVVPVVVVLLRLPPPHEAIRPEAPIKEPDSNFSAFLLADNVLSSVLNFIIFL